MVRASDALNASTLPSKLAALGMGLPFMLCAAMCHSLVASRWPSAVVRVVKKTVEVQEPDDVVEVRVPVPRERVVEVESVRSRGSIKPVVSAQCTVVRGSRGDAVPLADTAHACTTGA